jgi:predicted transposase/invertase (TIGR01784 family)
LKPKNDFIFGRLFGEKESKESLIALLNAILRQDGLDPIVQLKVIDNKQLKKLMMGEKTGSLDIRADLASGEQINIEMQIANRNNMIQRTLFYMAKLFIASIKAGEKARSTSMKTMSSKRSLRTRSRSISLNFRSSSEQ